MSTEKIEVAEIAKQPLTVKSLLERDDVKKRFEEMLGKKAQSFIVSVLQIINSNTQLKNAEPMSVYNAASLAATLDLPLNNSLGFAYIIPYNQKYQDDKKNWQTRIVAQFQIGAKGFNQLAQRSGQFLAINTSDVREGELVYTNRLSGEMKFEWIQNEAERLAKPVIGYVSYFKLINGFEKIFYMTISQLNSHGKKYSKTWGQKGSKWEDPNEFPAMALKTVLKLNLSKNAPLSIEMQKAISTDQSLIKDEKGDEVEYIDNTEDIGHIEINKVEMTEKMPVFLQAVEHLKNGGSLDKIEENYIITKEIRTLLFEKSK